MASLLVGRTKRRGMQPLAWWMVHVLHVLHVYWVAAQAVCMQLPEGARVSSRRIDALLDAVLDEAVMEERENPLAPLGIRRPAR